MIAPALNADAGPTPADRKLCGRLAIVGGFNGTHLGGSLWRAATHLGIDGAKFDVSDAGRGNRILRAALWRFGDRRPPGMHRFSKAVVVGCRQAEPEILIATGAVPLTGSALRRLRAMGIVCVNYSTDDPWNPALRACWHLRLLPEYDLVFTTRRENIGSFADIGCGEVHYLPFGYDEWLFCRCAPVLDEPAPDVLFVGGADRDRVAFMTEFLRAGQRVALVGGYWERFPAMRPYALGQRAPEALSALTVAAKVNLCLVRRANRDGHVMRSFEIAALGGCMLAEDTAEHQEIFGPDGEAVVYFRTPCEAAERARSLLADPAERARLSAAVRTRILRGAHSYRDRLVTIVEAATRSRRAHSEPGQSARPVTRRLKIAIATAGRFHVLDLAREMHALGHHVRFYSYVPRARARRFGLPDECHVPLLSLVLPAVAWQGLMPRLMPRTRERVLYALLNRGVMMRLRPCDVFICMSGIYLEAARFAKQRYGATIWLERGSRHILSQDEILASIPDAERPSPLTIRRELAGYTLADRVAIPSHHVAESFRRDASTHSKLFYNPYGVDLAMFPLRPEKGRSEPLSFLFVGTWSLQKGCDLLAEAVRKVPGVCLIHVGAIGDLDFPAHDDRFVHVDPVPQPELARFYAAADVFVLASRQDGFGVVLSQALASGLPLICTDRTGGPDLAHTPALAARITVVPAGDLDALALAMAVWRARLRAHNSLPPLCETDRETLSWAAYVRRHSDELLSTIGSG